MIQDTYSRVVRRHTYVPSSRLPSGYRLERNSSARVNSFAPGGRQHAAYAPSYFNCKHGYPHVVEVALWRPADRCVAAYDMRGGVCEACRRRHQALRRVTRLRLVPPAAQPPHQPFLRIYMSHPFADSSRRPALRDTAAAQSHMLQAPLSPGAPSAACTGAVC